jgi:hypothetical protein
MSDRSTARYSFIWRRRLRSTAMWVIRWDSASSRLLTLRSRRRRFLLPGGILFSRAAFAATGTSAIGAGNDDATAGASLPARRKLPAEEAAAHAAALKVS